MKTTSNRTKIVVLLALVCFGFGLNFGVPASAQQQVTNPQKTSPKPTAAPTITRTPAPAPTVSPVATPTPAAMPVPVQTVADLQSRIRTTLARAEIRRGRVGVKIASLDTNKTIFENEAEKYFMPASNMKSYTVAAALEKLSPDFRFATSVYAAAAPDANGVVPGDLSIYGRGDVSLSYSFNDGDYLKGIDALAVKIAAAGVRRIEGNLIGDASYFTGGAIPASWEWDDLQWNSGAEVSALPINNNVIDLSVKPASAAGAPCAVQLAPFNSVVSVVNRCATTTADVKRALQIEKKLDRNIIEISGTMPAGDKGFAGFVTVSRPAELFLALLRQSLMRKGVVVTGQNRVLGAADKIVLPTVLTASGASIDSTTASAPIVAVPAAIEIAKLESPPFSLIAAKTMKPSQNLYTETILRALGEQMKNAYVQTSNRSTPPITILPLDNPFSNPKAESSALGVFAVQNFLREAGVAPDSVIQHDGSGLSRHNLVTPASAVQLYMYMSRSRYAAVWRESLPIGAVDGTLKDRFAGTAAANNVRAKTGTIDQVAALSGYVTTAAGERLVFSIIVNEVADVRIRQAVIDEIVVALANFNGRTN